MAAAAAALASLALAASASAGMSFNNGKLIDAGNRQTAIELGNFTGDAYPDVVSADSNAGTTSLFVNRTDDWFFGASGWPKSVGGDAFDVVAGDFNSDSKLDTAVAVHSTNSLKVFLGDGAGGATEGQTHGTGTGPFEVTTGFLNGDAHLDLVTANQANTVPTSPPSVSVYLGAGDGTFAAAGSVVTGGNAALTRGAAIGDVTGDGKRDIVAVNSNTNKVVILVGDGDGEFALSPTTYDTTQGPRRVVLGDFDENGSLDIATADSGDGVPANPANRNNKTTVLLNNGSGSFTAATGSPFTTGPSLASTFAIRTIDFDGDGHLDLAAVHRHNSSLSVLRGDGNGGFEPHVRLGYPEFDPGSPPEATDLVVGDTNQDGKPDLIGNAAGSPGFLISFLNTTTVDAPTVSATTPASPSNDNGPEVTGTAEADAIVKLFTTSNCAVASQVGSGSGQDFSTTGVTATVPSDQTTTLYAQASNVAGWAVSACSSTSVAYTEDSTPPATPSIVMSQPSSPSPENDPVFNGSADDDTTIRLHSDAACTTRIGQGPEGQFGASGGGIGVGLDTPFAADSTNPVRATSTDAAGNESGCSGAFTYVEDSTPPAKATSLTTVPASPSNNQNPRVKGTIAGSETFFVSIYSSSDCSGGVVTDGFSSSFEGAGLSTPVAANDTTTLTVRSQDQAGNLSDCSDPLSYTHDNVAPGAPTGLQTDPASPADDESPSVSGSVDPDTDTVRIYQTDDCNGSFAVASRSSFEGGGFEILVDPDTTIQVTATAVDAASNVSDCSDPVAYTEDSTDPGAPTGLATTPASPSRTDTTPQVRGNADADTDRVRIYETTDCTGSFTEGSKGSFEGAGIEVTVDANATTDLSATAVDAAGNEGDCSDPIAYTHDSIAPNVPTITSTDPASPSNVRPIQVHGTAAGDVVTISLYRTADCNESGGRGDAVVALFTGPGGMPLQVPANATTQLSAKAYDAAGNLSACSNSISYTHDSIAPSAPSGLATTPASPSRTSTNPRVTGSATADTVTVRVFKTNDCSGPSTDDARAIFESGGIEVGVSANQATQLSAQAVDAAANVSDCSTATSYTHDSLAPNAPTALATDPVSPANDATPRVRGSASGDTVQVSVFKSNDCTGSFTVGTKASFEGAGLEVTVGANQSTQLSATAFDAAGNESACSSTISYTEDSAEPAAPTGLSTDPVSPANDTTPRVKGSAPADAARVRIFESNDCTGSPTEGNGAAFEGAGIEVTVAANEVTQLSADVVDAAGNPSDCSTPIAYTEDSAGPAEPTALATDPASPADDTTPRVNGSAAADAEQVRVYKTNDCSGPATTDTKATFEGAGIEVTVPANQVTQLSARAVDAVGNPGACSAPIAYREDSAAPGAPTGLATTPASPSGDTTPLVKGEVDADADEVLVFKSADCTGPSADGTAAGFEGAGIEVTVPAEQTTQLTAQAVDALGHESACSAAIAYTHRTPTTPPDEPNPPDDPNPPDEPVDPNLPSDGPDAIDGTTGDDVIDGMEGDDEIFGGAGDDLLNGGAGADSLAGGLGADEVRGGDGDDEISGGKGDDELFGGPGADELDGGPGNDRVSGGGGRDSIEARDGEADKINCGKGSDTVKADGKDDLSANCEEAPRRR